MSLYKVNAAKPPVGVTEFEILKSSHRFLREDDQKPTSWDDQLAAKYYSSLYREFALCDLKHYKSGNFALRWRTEEEVLSGAGEVTCGNTRCDHHFAASSSSHAHSDWEGPRSSSSNVPLTTLELPFTYVEHGEAKSALVKVVLCGKCLKKLMWKRTKEKSREAVVSSSADDSKGSEELEGEKRPAHRDNIGKRRHEEEEVEKEGHSRKKRSREESGADKSIRKARHTRLRSSSAGSDQRHRHS